MPSSSQAESSGNESAEQQLFAETQASSPKPQQPPTTAAIRSANLLNAARVDKLRPASHPPSSSPIQTATTSVHAGTSDGMTVRKGGASKLKRPSYLRGELAPRQNLARRGDVYELDLDSPQKDSGTPYKLSETVNHNKPLKRVKKNNKGQGRNHEPEALANSSSPPSAQPVRTPEDGGEPSVATRALRHSSRRTAGGADQEAETEPRKSRRLAGQSTDTTSLRPRKSRAKRKAATQTSTAENPSKSPRRENQHSPELLTQNLIGTEQRSSRSGPIVMIPKAKSKTGVSKKALVTESDDQAPSESERQLNGNGIGSTGHQDDVRTTKPIPAKRSRGRPPRASGTLPPRSIPAASDKSTRTGTKSTEPTSSAIPDAAHLEQGSNEDDDKYKTEEISADESEVEKPGPVPDFKQVLAFSQSKSPRGTCQSGQAIVIKRLCHSSKLMFELPETTSKEVFTCLQQLRSDLSDYGVDSDTKERILLKVDAYSYLFREMATYWIQLHAWLERCYGKTAESLESMRSLVALGQRIISFKDEIASWDAPLPQNDRLVKNVNARLIAPLRRLVSSYRDTFDKLKKRVELDRKREQARQERRREDLETSLRKEKWPRWQDLHIWRQEAEPDIRRRVRLFLNPALFAARLEENWDERDANGVVFERIPLFRERESPPPRASAVPEVEWADEQMAALIEGLERFAGPNVFRQIFRRYCRPGGALRELTVSEITAQAASIRSTLQKQYKGNNWDIPAWITDIPVLP